MSFNKILIVSMGNGGNAVASAFIENLLKECGVGSGGEVPADAGLAGALQKFCDLQSNGKLVPRHIMAANADSPFPTSAYGGLYPAEAKITESEEYGKKNHAKGYKAPTVSNLIQLVQQRVSALNNQCVIWLFHSLGGGYGSGAGASFIEQFADEESAPLVSFPILPYKIVSKDVWEPYNAVLGLPFILKGASLILPIDNKGLYQAAEAITPTPMYGNLNAVLANALTTLVSPMLWPDKSGQRLSVDEFHKNLSNQSDPEKWFDGAERGPSYERIVTLSNYCDATSPQENNLALATRAVAGAQGGLGTAAMNQWLKQFVVIRGTQSDTSDFGQAASAGSTRLALNPKASQKRAIVAGVNTGVIHRLQDLMDDYTEMYEQKAYLHWYTHEGVDEYAFTEAEEKIREQLEAFESVS